MFRADVNMDVAFECERRGCWFLRSTPDLYFGFRAAQGLCSRAFLRCAQGCACSWRTCTWRRPTAGEQAGAPLERPQELHRFLVHGPDGRRLESVAEKRCALYRPLSLSCTAPRG